MERRLPPELVVAEHLGVSRNLIRDCLSTLEREGFISRKRGVGTIINKHVLDVRVRMDLEEEFMDMVRRSGYEPGLSFVKNGFEEASKDVAAHFLIPEESKMYCSKRLVTADGQPAIYCEDYLPNALIKHPDCKLKNENAPVFDFLRQACGCEVVMDLTEVRPVSADAYLAEQFKVPVGTALLFMDEVGYDFWGSPILNSREYYVDGLLKHIVLRKMI